ncbi:MAG: STAS domain-containing protein [Ignavibacteriales bacterium]|nr:STAS domain-containing protein [Ignavibacteriales bacterium]
MIINLAEVSFMDSFFLGAIVSGLKKVKSHGGEMKLVHLQPPLHPVFELMHLNKVFNICESMDEAVTSF